VQNYLKTNPVFAAVLGAILVLTALVWLKFGGKISRFISEVGVELAKCTWPWDPAQKGLAKYKELIDSTVVVVISSILLAAFVTSADFLLMKVVGALTRGF
jgi:preprotein translocase subunit SecE